MYCSAPWTTVQIKNDGQFSYCCMSRDPLGSTLNDPKLVEGRKKIINGEVLPVCQERCFDIEELFSSQQYYLTKHYPIKNKVTEIANPLDIEYIDLRMGNICNFMCLMCGDRDSHLWGKVNGKENPYISWAQTPEKYNEIINFIDSCKNLKSISLAGGEPFYNKTQLFDIINKLDRNIDLKLITNTSFCDEEIIDKLNEFDRGRLHCSVDGIEDWIELQRHKSNWDNIEKNLLTYAEKLNYNWDVRLVPTFTVLNTLGADIFVDWFLDHLNKIRDKSYFSYTICTVPPRMSPYILPLELRQNIVRKIRKSNFNINNPTIERLSNALEKDIKPNKQDIKDLKKYLEYVKNSLNLDVIEKIPILEEVFGE